MKKRLIITALIIGFAVMASCSKDTKGDLSQDVPGNMSVEIDPGTEPENREKIKTVRIIVFGNVSTSKPRLEANEYIEVKEPQNTGEKIKVTDIEVLVGKDQMAVVIVNEPQTAFYSLKDELDDIRNAGDLERLQYDIAEILNSDKYGDVIGTSGMPMVGVKRDIVTVAEEFKTAADNNVTMVVERAVSMVELYLEPITPVETGYTSGTSTVTVSNTSHMGYLVMGNTLNDTRDNLNPSKNFGIVKRDVPTGELKPFEWTASETNYWDNTVSDKRRLVCRFYVAERIFRADYSDRIMITMAGFKRGATTAGVSDQQIPTITNSDNGQVEAFTEFRRNNVYRITARVNELLTLDLSISVKPWDKIDVEVPIIY